MRTRTKILLGVIALLVVGGVVYAQTRPAPPPQVTTEAVRIGTLRSTVVETGSIESSREVKVTPLISGKVLKVNVRAGDTVTAGTIIAQVDSSAVVARLRQTQASVDRATATLALAVRGAKPEEVAAQKQAVSNAQRALEKARAVLDASSASAQRDVASSQQTVASSQSRLATSQAKVRDVTASGNADVSSLQTQLNGAEQKVARLQSQASIRQRINAARNDVAEQAVDAAEDVVDRAEDAVNDAAGGTQETLTKLRGALTDAENALRTAELNRDTTRRNGELDAAQAEDALSAAREQRDLLQRQLESTRAKTQQSLNDAQAAAQQAGVDLAAQRATFASQQAAADLKRRNAESALAQAEAQLSTAQAQLTTLTRTLTDVDLGVTKADLASAKASLEETRATLANYTLTAPIGGVISFLDVREGENVGPQQVVAKVTNLSTLRVAVNVSENDVRHVRMSLPVEMSLDAIGPATVLSGIVRELEVGPTVQQGVIFYRARIAFTDGVDTSLLRPGMTVNATIITADVKDVLLVSTRAVKQKDGRTVVSVQRPDKTLEEREVKVGRRGDDAIEVLSGLSVGDLAVTFQK